MGLFGKKKTCAICGGEIGLLGNRKLEDGNMCKKCAAKLSPWFSDRRRSTVDSIKEQLAYREANKEDVAKFQATLTFGTDSTKVYLDEDDRKFIVSSANPRKWDEANPDVIDFSQVTGVDIDIDEDVDEDMREDKEGRNVSYNPPRYFYSYDFYVIIRVNNPYFDTIKFKLNSSEVKTTSGSVPANMKPYPEMNNDYSEYKKMGEDIKAALTSARQQVRDEAAEARKPKKAVICQCCGASTIPDANGRCEFCGGAAE